MSRGALIPQACHACDTKFTGSHCPVCKEARPLYTALKNEAARRRAGGVQPIAKPLQPCRYKPASLCDCGQRGDCVEVA